MLSQHVQKPILKALAPKTGIANLQYSSEQWLKQTAYKCWSSRGSAFVSSRAYCTPQSWKSPPPGMRMPNMGGGNPETGPEVEKGWWASGGIGWAPFTLMALIGGGFYWYSRRRRAEIEESRRKVQVAGEARIGGTWSLVDHTGRPMTSTDFWGKYALIYFGFTYCPDICPLELKKMTEALKMLSEEEERNIVPMMVTVDPWRDSIAGLSSYVTDFHPRLLGLTGTPQQVDHITKSFRVYTSKGPEESEGDYLMDHSIFMYLMDKEGKFLDYYGVAMEADEIAQSIKNHLVVAGDIPEPGLLGSIRWWWIKKSTPTNTK